MPSASEPCGSTAAGPGGDDDDMDSEAGDSLITFDYAALEEAQRIAAKLDEEGGENDDEHRKRKQRGGCKETIKKRKKQRREDDVIRAKQAGLPVPSLKELLAASAASSSGSGTTVPASSSAAPAPPATLASTGAEASTASSAAQASAKRLAKEAARRSKIAEAVNARTVFVTNLPFKVTEREVTEWLGSCGKVKHVRLSKDKGTGKFLGYAHVQFESSESVAAAIEKCDRFDVQGRVIRVARVGKGERCQFELPQELKDDILALIHEAYEGKNISTIKDAWQKRHPGQKLDTAKYGFKNFSTAMRTIEGLSLEHHVEKKLTFLAFFTGSDVHKAFLEERAQATVTNPEAGVAVDRKRAREETEAVPGQPSSSDAAEPQSKKRCAEVPFDEGRLCENGDSKADSNNGTRQVAERGSRRSWLQARCIMQ
jgi:RNA recognition motif-containing protein